MQGNMDVATPQTRNAALNFERSAAKNGLREVARLRSDIERMAHDIRMKSKGASAEIQTTRRMLEREAMRFAADAEETGDQRQRDMIEAGQNLRARFQKLADEIAWPMN